MWRKWQWPAIRDQSKLRQELLHLLGEKEAARTFHSIGALSTLSSWPICCPKQRVPSCAFRWGKWDSEFQSEPDGHTSSLQAQRSEQQRSAHMGFMDDFLLYPLVSTRQSLLCWSLEDSSVPLAKSGARCSCCCQMCGCSQEASEEWKGCGSRLLQSDQKLPVHIKKEKKC
jgi:hypothetical protein